MGDRIPGRLQHRHKTCCEKVWPPWKVGLYVLKVVSPQRCCFWTDGLVYDRIAI